MTYEMKQFFLWLDQAPLHFGLPAWRKHYSELIDALYANYVGWDNEDFPDEDDWPDVYDELANDPRS